MIESGECIFSPCRQYRYTLWRDLPDRTDFAFACGFGGGERTGEGDKYWRPEGSVLLVIGLNPSTADETQNDPTIRRCIGFAQSWGFRQLCMMNAFAFRSTDPKEMKAQADPVGPDNDHHLKQLLFACHNSGGLALAAWGVHGDWKDRDMDIEAMAGNLHVPLHCLGKTRLGQPRHPLYINKTVQPIPYP